MGFLDYLNSTSSVSKPSENDQIPLTLEGGDRKMLLMVGNASIYQPRFSTIKCADGLYRPATGWNEGLLSYWAHQENDGGANPTLSTYYKYVDGDNHYLFRWLAGGTASLVRRKAAVSTTLYNAAPPKTFAMDVWNRVRVQFRWTSGAHTTMEHKIWVDNGDGTGWNLYVTQADTDPIADSAASTFRFGGLNVATVSRQGYYARLRMQLLPSPLL